MLDEYYCIECVERGKDRKYGKDKSSDPEESSEESSEDYRYKKLK